MKIIDYVNLMPGSRRRLTAEDRERMKKLAVELSKIVKERNLVFVTAKAPPIHDACGTLHATGIVLA